MSVDCVGANAEIDADVTIGYEHQPNAEPPVLGDRAVVRSGSIIYTDVEIGDDLITGHDVLIREETTIGDSVIVGTQTVIDGKTTIGSDVSLQTGVYIPQETTIGDNVFIGPKAVLTNDPYPVRGENDLVGPVIEDGVSIGANATLLPGVTVGRGSFVAAGSVVTKDVPPETLAIGSPAEHRALTPELTPENTLHD